MKERIGKRKGRKYNTGQEKLGYYVIVTDTAETEKNDKNFGKGAPAFSIPSYIPLNFLL